MDFLFYTIASYLIFLAYTRKNKILEIFLDKYAEIKLYFSNDHEEHSAYGLVETLDPCSISGNGSNFISSEVVIKPLNDYCDVIYKYNNVRHKFRIFKETTFPLYTYEDLDSSPCLDFSNIYMKDENNSDVRIDNISDIIMLYSGPKGNFYQDKFDFKSENFYISELSDYYNKSYYIIIETIFGDILKIDLKTN